MNCVGRIFIGLFLSPSRAQIRKMLIFIGIFTDFVKNRMGLRRAYCIPLVAVFFFSSQLVAMSIVDVNQLWKASLLVGFSYGSLFGLFPTIIIDWFGMRTPPLFLLLELTPSFSPPTHTVAHFSENWGFVALSPMIGGNLFSLAFGRNLDEHSASDESNLPPTTSPDTTIHAQCMQGAKCYIWSLKLTTWACVLALGLAVLAGYQDWKKSKEDEKVRGYSPVFDDGDDDS
jgi:hypothetical protein